MSARGKPAVTMPTWSSSKRRGRSVRSAMGLRHGGSGPAARRRGPRREVRVASSCRTAQEGTRLLQLPRAGLGSAWRAGSRRTSDHADPRCRGRSGCINRKRRWRGGSVVERPRKAGKTSRGGPRRFKVRLPLGCGWAALRRPSRAGRRARLVGADGFSGERHPNPVAAALRAVEQRRASSSRAEAAAAASAGSSCCRGRPGRGRAEGEGCPDSMARFRLRPRHLGGQVEAHEVRARGSARSARDAVAEPRALWGAPDDDGHGV